MLFLSYFFNTFSFLPFFSIISIFSRVNFGRYSLRKWLSCFGSDGKSKSLSLFCCINFAILFSNTNGRAFSDSKTALPEWSYILSFPFFNSSK